MGRPLEFGEDFGDWRKKKSTLDLVHPVFDSQANTDGTAVGSHPSCRSAVHGEQSHSRVQQGMEVEVQH